MTRIAEYIWIDGIGELRSKTRTIGKYAPEWQFDGSSSEQAKPEESDCVLKPVKQIKNPLLPDRDAVLVLCEVNSYDGTPDKHNFRQATESLSNKVKEHQPMFGLEQEYTLLTSDNDPLGWTENPPEQGPFYCGVGRNKEYGAIVAEEHMMACLDAGLKWCGKNAEVMPGQHEYQIGICDPLELGDDVWLSRFLLIKIADAHGFVVSFHAKPVLDLNGAGAHTNFSTLASRLDIAECYKLCRRLGEIVVQSPVKMDKVYEASHYPEMYGGADESYKARLTGQHETCSWKEFKFGISDRSASIRIPRHVVLNGRGYIEDRRPCADADPYRVASYLMGVLSESV